jgi:hypothetical protein
VSSRRYAVLLLIAFIFVILAALARAASPRHLSLWLCIHRHEQSAWNDPNAPYWGGLQLGVWFLGHYAHPAGTPDQWTPMEQMRVAENAYRRERFSLSWLHGQWPTSYGCA